MPGRTPSAATGQTIRDLGESGVTVLLSSHILAEVQQVCHSVSIIGEGRLVATGNVADLVGDSTLAVARVRVEDSSAAIRHLVGWRHARPACCPTTKLLTIGNIGKVHGVKANNKPKPKNTGKTTSHD